MAEMQFDRRRYRRFDLPCPATLARGEEVLARIHTVNISDGGALVAMQLEDIPPAGQKVDLNLSLPRSTDSTYMLEKFRSEAQVKRHQPLTDERYAAVALEFVNPVDLQIEP